MNWFFWCFLVNFRMSLLLASLARPLASLAPLGPRIGMLGPPAGEGSLGMLGPPAGGASRAQRGEAVGGVE